MADWFRSTETGLTLFVRVTPNAPRDVVEGVETRDDGTAALRLRVKAVPDKGKANTAVIALLARALGLPKSDFAFIAGETSRMKTVRVAGDSASLASRASALT